MWTPDTLPFLVEHSQRVLLSNYSPARSHRVLSYGVLQGIIWSLLLFNMYVRLFGRMEGWHGLQCLYSADAMQLSLSISADSQLEQLKHYLVSRGDRGIDKG